MSREQFIPVPRFREENSRRLEIINGIVDEYAGQGYKLTLRQLYYQLVSRDIIPNQQAEYAKLSTLLVKGRMAGIVDWDAIEDRLRQPKLPYWAADIPGAVDDLLSQYRLDRQKDQTVYIEVWCEKDALSSVLYYVTAHYHINLMVNRGYSSCTAMYDAYKRFSCYSDRDLVILYLGDHDPSGLDMVRDIENRLDEFGRSPEIVHVALTREQIEQYNPPPNPAKMTDPRASEYVSQHGQLSWEIDALQPDVLHRLVRENIETRISLALFNEQINQEEQDKDSLERFKQEFE